MNIIIIILKLIKNYIILPLKFFFKTYIKSFLIKHTDSIYFIIIILSIFIFYKYFTKIFIDFFLYIFKDYNFKNIFKVVYLKYTYINNFYNIIKNFIDLCYFFYHIIIFINKIIYLTVTIIFKKELIWYFNIYKYLINLNYSIIKIFTIITLFFFLVILSIWTRACGPRVRIDQLNNLVWKDLIILLFIIIFIYLTISIYY